MHRAFVDPSFIDAVVRGETNRLPESAAKRLLKVVRVKKGEEVGLFDGCGREVRGIIDEHAVLAHTRLLERSFVAPGIYLIQAVSEEKKLLETIARGAEFGIDGFLIFEAERSTPYSFDKAVKKRDRLEAIAIDACRQSGRFFVPSITFFENLHAVGNALLSHRLGVVGDVEGEGRILEAVAKIDQAIDAIYIAIGPEGGLDTQELAYLRTLGLIPCTWSRQTLRTELAFIPPLVIMQSAINRL